MKKLMLLLIMVGFGMNAQNVSLTKDPDWNTIEADYQKLYSLATDLSEETEMVAVGDNVVSFVLKSGTISLEQKRDKSKSVEFYNYVLMSTAGKMIRLDSKNLANSVVSSFMNKCIILKEKLKESNSDEIQDILTNLFQNNE